MTTLATTRPVAPDWGLSRWAAAMAQAIARRWVRRTTAAALNQLSDRELADIGLSRDDVPGAALAAVRDAAPILWLR